MDFFDFLKVYKNIILGISITLNVVLLILSGVLLYKNKTFKCDVKGSEVAYQNEDDTKEDIAPFYVEVKGAVENPGVYLVNKNNIVNDVILKASGFLEDAYTDNINLSKKVSEELVIYVYTKEEYLAKNNENNNVLANAEFNEEDNICESNSYDISDCLNDVNSEIITNGKDKEYDSEGNITTSDYEEGIYIEEDNEDSENTLININTASIDELMSLNGIGSTKAKSIIEYRNNYGKFKSIEEIKNVKGIGDALFNKIKEDITV